MKNEYDGSNVRKRAASAESRAEASGCHTQYPAANELFVDIDTEWQYEKFLKSIKLLLGVDGYTPYASKSGLPHRHIVVVLDRCVDARERILLQACLGSDPVREMCSLQELDAGVPEPTLFFEPLAQANVRDIDP